MRGLNRVFIAGNLARDPDVRYTVNKRAWARFSVAVNYRYKDANGEYKDGVDYVPIAAWGSVAETCEKYLKKGSPVLIEGRINSRSYEANDGSGKRYVTEVNADTVILLGSGQGNRITPSSSGDSMSYAVETPADSEFGSINDHGFTDVSGFGSGNNNESMSDTMGDSEIPF